MTVDRFEGSTPRPWTVADVATGVPRGTCVWVLPPPGVTLDRVADCGASTAPGGQADAALIVYAVNLMDAWQAVAEAARALMRTHDNADWIRLQSALARLAEAEKENT